jgi:hypothetical protein
MFLARILAGAAMCCAAQASDLRGTIEGASRPVVVYLSGKHLAPPGPTSLTVEHRRDGISPRLIIVPTGTIVTLRNADSIFHSPFSVASGNHFEGGFLERGGRRSVALPASGVVPVFCRLHAHESAVIVVVPSRFSMIVEEEDTFMFKNVPPGTHELIAWTPSRGTARIPVVIPDSGVFQAEVAWDRPRTTLGGL